MYWLFKKNLNVDELDLTSEIDDEEDAEERREQYQYFIIQQIPRKIANFELMME